MAEYNAPGVYMESVTNTARSVSGISTDTFGFVGVVPRGSLDEPIYVTSWNNFIEKCAGGLSSQFLANYDLSYAVYGFFQNGGTKAYISRVASEDAAKATSTGGEATLTMSAKDEGSWGNKLKVTITANAISITPQILYVSVQNDSPNFQTTAQFTLNVVSMLG